jgi:amino acid adenylation domain-containing protein
MQEISGARTFVAGQEGIEVLSELCEMCPDIAAIVLPESAEIPGELLRFCGRGGSVVTSVDLAGVEPLAQPISPPSGGPAYLMFTSGSTGIPKAVAVSRGAAGSWLESMLARYALGSADRASHITPLDFDCSLLEVLMPLSCGACVCVPDQRERFNLGNYLAARRLTVWVSSPSTAALMQQLGVLGPDSFPDLRITIFGSEGLPVDLALTWAKAAPHSIIDNVYGPTELTVCCAAYRIDPATVAALADNGVVPIGQPLPGMRAMVVDDHLQPVAPGQTGELLMTGPQLADGYWGNPELSAEVFVTPPAETDVFYRTRDRVRRPLPGNPLTFLGRLDDQFKINGIRVEPGEIEASLRRAAGCDTAVVVGWPAGKSSASGVVGFVEATSVDEVAVVRRLRDELPRHMVPRRVIARAVLPRTPRGKLDRRACADLVAEHVGPSIPSGSAPVKKVD